MHVKKEHETKDKKYRQLTCQEERKKNPQKATTARDEDGTVTIFWGGKREIKIETKA